jgi:transcriptional regulator with XRE-family HTH domain
MTINVTTGQVPSWTPGDRFRKAREIRGLTQAQLAEMLGVSQRTVARAEESTESHLPKRPVMVAWALGTAVPLSWLETGADGGATPGPGISLPHLDSNQEPFGLRLAPVRTLRSYVRHEEALRPAS